MRSFKIRDGKFKFEVYTDDKNVVIAKLLGNDGDHIVGKGIRKGEDVFDIHVGLKVAIRKCMNFMKAMVTSTCMKLLRTLDNDLNQMRFYDKEKFTEFMKKLPERKAKREAKREAKMKGNK